MKIAEVGIKVIASREVIHEMYYVLRNLGMLNQEIIVKISALRSLPNIECVPTTVDVDLLALTLTTEYGLSSIFDAYHTSTCILFDRDKVIISTDHVYGRIPQIKRLDPSELA